MKQRRDFYHIKINEAAARDICKLKSLALEFSKPEILYKLIYETYYKTKMEELFSRILGDKKNTGGIYKITNINNEKIIYNGSDNIVLSDRNPVLFDGVRVEINLD